MAFTRFHDDPARIRKTLEESTFSGRYFLETPGNGVDMPLQLDPQLRLQRWGANMHSNAINLESDFRGLTRKLNRDLVSDNSYRANRAETVDFVYPTANPIIDESRATHPAFLYRDLEQTRWEYPWINPQDNVERVFPWNLQTRILEKDNYTPKMPAVLNVERSDFYFPR
jgi:hypothetical protein